MHGNTGQLGCTLLLFTAVNRSRRKPTDKGHVTSIEAYNEAGDLIIQFFGKRIERQDERGAWREIVENLPRVPVSQVA